jgi:hypothetical protein
MGIGRVRSAALASVKCRAEGLLTSDASTSARRADPLSRAARPQALSRSRGSLREAASTAVNGLTSQKHS